MMLRNYPFQRVHQSFLVNLMCVRRYIKKGKGHLILNTGISIPVARSKKEDLISVLGL